jgi:hypothetical protein
MIHPLRILARWERMRLRAGKGPVQEDMWRRALALGRLR